MKKVIAIALAVALLAGALGGGLAVGSSSQPASKATAFVANVNVVDSTMGPTTILQQEIKIPGNRKDLFVDVSLETGLFTDTLVQSKGGNKESAEAWARTQVMVRATPIDNEGTFTGPPIIAEPNMTGGWVTFDYRLQYLSATLQGIINDIVCTTAPGPDGEYGTADDVVTCVIDETTLTEEEIELLLDTMAAHSFNFILADLDVDTYLVEVLARIATDTTVSNPKNGGPTDPGSSAEATATIGLGSVTIEAVRMIHGEVIEVVD